jgi:hypothetical protein
MQEFILTGGGSNTPTVRETLLEAANDILKSKRFYWRSSFIYEQNAVTQQLDGALTRVASAIGASIYDERAVHVISKTH